MEQASNSSQEASPIISEERRLFQKRIDAHILSISEYSSGKEVGPLRIEKDELELLIRIGVVSEKFIPENTAYPPQALLFVTFQEEPLEITITDRGIVQIHRPEPSSSPQIRSGPNPIPSQSVPYLKGGIIGKVMRLFLGSS